MGSIAGEAGERPKAQKEGRSEDPSDLPYENLPFHGFHKPPKKVKQIPVTNVVFKNNHTLRIANVARRR